MDKYLIKKDKVKQFLAKISKGVEFIAPVAQTDGDIVFDTPKKVDEVVFDYGNPSISPRTFMFPQSECIADCSIKTQAAKENVTKKKRIIFGMRPCDATALTLMKRFFSDKFKDPYYFARLDNTTVIVLACSKPCGENSFCDSMDAGPIARNGFDLQFVDLGGGYYVEAQTEHGEKLVAANRSLFNLAPKNCGVAIRETIKNFKAKQNIRIEPVRVYHIMKQDKVDDAIWRDIGIRCQTCGGCIFSCPTCSCFNIVDLNYSDKTERTRVWDGCPFEGFTRMAGGANPVKDRKNRIRRFFEHKLNVDYERYGRPSCVGCGRCITTCPGNISIVKMMQEAVKCLI